MALPEQIGRYRILRLLGKGGMGEVWRAKHSALVRPAAIKLMRPARGLGWRAGRGRAADARGDG